MSEQPVSGPSDPNVPNAAAANAAAYSQYFNMGATPADPGNANNNAGTPQGYKPGQQPDGSFDIQITVGGKIYLIKLNRQLDPTQPFAAKPLSDGRSRRGGQGFEDAPDTTIVSKLGEIESWYGNATKRSQIIQQMYAAGLVTSKKAPSATEVINAWALIVQEAALENKSGTTISPEDLLAKAAKTGWNSISASIQPSDAGAVGTGNLNNAADASTTSSQTIYKSYLDPATVMGAQADAWFRLMGRNPTQQEYQSFLNSVFAYQDADNTGKFESQTKDPSDTLTGDNANNAAGIAAAQNDPNMQTTTVSQRGIGTRGLQFLAGQAALSNPEEGAYQAATTYFNAFIKALSGPASGMQASGPTTTVP